MTTGRRETPEPPATAAGREPLATPASRTQGVDKSGYPTSFEVPPSDTARRVWAALEADPEFNARMERGKAELTAGRGVLFRVEERRNSDRRSLLWFVVGSGFGAAVITVLQSIR